MIRRRPCLAPFVSSCAVGLALTLLAGCTPDLTRIAVAPDNAPAGEDPSGGFAPHVHGPVPLSLVSASDLADLTKPDQAPLCTVANGRAVAGAKMKDAQRYLASWTKARSNALPTKEIVQAGATKKGSTAIASASIAVPVVVEVSSPGDSNPTTEVASVAIDCTGVRAVLTVNGTARPADVIYAVDGTALGAGDYLFLAYDAAALDLTAIRLQYRDAGAATTDRSYPAWNAVDFRSFEGLLPAATLPARVTRKWDGNSGNYLDWLVVGFALPAGNALGADALIVRALMDNGKLGGTQYLDVAAVKAATK